MSGGKCVRRLKEHFLGSMFHGRRKIWHLMELNIRYASEGKQMEVKTVVEEDPWSGLHPVKEQVMKFNQGLEEVQKRC